MTDNTTELSARPSLLKTVIQTVFVPDKDEIYNCLVSNAARLVGRTRNRLTENKCRLQRTHT